MKIPDEVMEIIKKFIIKNDWLFYMIIIFLLVIFFI